MDSVTELVTRTVQMRSRDDDIIEGAGLVGSLRQLIKRWAMRPSSRLPMITGLSVHHWLPDRDYVCGSMCLELQYN